MTDPIERGVTRTVEQATKTSPPAVLEPLVAIFVTSWIVTGRYTDRAARARRSEPLPAATEVQWDILPPLARSTEQVAVSGILEPAYAIGGDSFDLCVRLD